MNPRLIRALQSRLSGPSSESFAGPPAKSACSVLSRSLPANSLPSSVRLRLLHAPRLSIACSYGRSAFTARPAGQTGSPNAYHHLLRSPPAASACLPRSRRRSRCGWGLASKEGTRGIISSSLSLQHRDVRVRRGDGGAVDGLSVPLCRRLCTRTPPPLFAAAQESEVANMLS